MTLDEAKQHLIQAWGTLGSSWGVSRTMAQVHALLLVSPVSMTTEDIMDALQISRGNVNMNVRDLIDWGIVRKVLKPGERKEFFEIDDLTPLTGDDLRGQVYIVREYATRGVR